MYTIIPALSGWHSWRPSGKKGGLGRYLTHATKRTRVYTSNLKFSFIALVSMSNFGILRLPHCRTRLSWWLAAVPPHAEVWPLARFAEEPTLSEAQRRDIQLIKPWKSSRCDGRGYGRGHGRPQRICFPSVMANQWGLIQIRDRWFSRPQTLFVWLFFL